MPPEKSKLHTGVPFLDSMIDASISKKYYSPEPNQARDVKSDPYDFGSILIPNGKDITRSNVLIKGDPGSGKTILAC
jgi:KaiC/GvpD/RAD55 family RecA-like ATPase